MNIKLPELFDFKKIDFNKMPKSLGSFLQKNMEDLNKAITCVQESVHYKPHYSQQAISELKTQWDEKKAAIKDTSLEDMGEFTKKLLDTNRYYSDKKKSEKFNQKKFWADLFAKELLQTNMQKRIHINNLLYVLWNDQAYFVLHSNESLLWLLPIVEKALLQAQWVLAEIKRVEKLKPKDSAAIDKFLEAIKTEFEKLKRIILNTMYARLVVANYAYENYGQLNTDDVIWYIQDFLQKEKLYPVSKERIRLAAKSPLSPRQTLTPAMASEFLSLLYQKSALHLISRYDELTFSQQDSQKNNGDEITIPLIRIKHKALLIPTTLKRFYPVWRGKPAWLFSDRHASAEFFERQQKNFIHLNYLKWRLPSIKKAAPFSEAEQKTFLSVFEETDEFVRNAIAHEKSYKTPWWQLRTRQLRKGWQALLHYRRVQITQQGLAFIKKIAEQSVPEDPEEKQFLWQRLLRCYSVLDKTLLSKEDNAQRKVLKKSLRVKLGQTAKLKAYGFIRAIARKELISIDEYQLLAETLENLKLGNTTFDPKQFAAPYTTRCLFQLTQKVKGLLKEDKAYDETLFKTTVSLIRIFDDKAVTLLLQKHITKYVIGQLLKILRIPSNQITPAQCAAMALEKFVKDYGDATLKNRFETLAYIRRSQSWQIYGEAVQELVDQISEPHQQRYFMHEIARVNSALDFILATQAKVQSQTNSYEAITNTLHNIVARLVKAEKECVMNIELTAHEETLVGLHHPERKIFQDAVELKATLILSQHDVEKNPAALSAKLNQLQNLSARYACVIPQLNTYISHKKPSYAGFFAKANRFTNNPIITLSKSEVNHHVSFHRI